ncbi:carbohydrate-binding domain-containing protein [Fibrivirga algicola]|uniref:Carbohydrate-binding domain-containing protein n=1 Tax=Fibrivirga algicola TaxID=2950420 RepID=A0ABX0QLK9_9BACT|nr:carbohydrate-binding domain-containing protein [Fibrivirga algicola]NID13325.1 carbohydrate-binding domain-containing protein [Fibrivirga algicola]
MYRNSIALVSGLLTLVLLILSCKTDELVSARTASITALNCLNATFSASATSGASYVATASIPYTGGNGADYPAGTAVPSTGVTGLTAELLPGTLATGNGMASFVIKGTPASAGTATFSISLGGQSCTLAVPVTASKASIATLTCTVAPAVGVSGTPYSGSVAMAYTGGNGGTYDLSSAASTGVEGLTATVQAGTLADGAGTLMYTITGTPTTSGTAAFTLSLGGKSCEVVVTINAAAPTVAPKDTVAVTYLGTTATVSNPFESEGVKVAVSGADVTVTSTNTTKEMVYLLSGTATRGSFKIYSQYKYNLALKGVSLTNSSGPAINSQSSKKATINVVAGTTNTLVDGITYASSTEDQKGTFFSEGQLYFTGTGTLNVTGNNKHAIVADDYIYVSQATITVKSAAKDGIHANDYFTMDNGTVNVTASSDGIEVEEGYIVLNGGNLTVSSVDDGIAATYEGTDTKIVPYIAIKGGNINVTTSGEKGNALKSEAYTTINTANPVMLTVGGKGAKGIKTSGDFTLSAGTVSINTTGSAFYETAAADITSPAGINCDKNLAINGGTLTIVSTGAGGKGISVDGTATVSGGKTTITASGAKYTYSSTLTSEAKGFKSDGAFTMTNGELTIAATDDGIKSEKSVTIVDGAINITKSYEGIESSTITIDGGTINVTATNDGINATYGTVSGGTESNDNSNLFMNGGTLIVAGSDAIDSNGNITINGGVIIVCGPTSQPEEGIDYNGTFLANGGILISGGSSANMTKAMSTASKQVSMYIKSSAQLAASSLLHIEDASGKELLTFKPRNAVSYFHFSNPALAKSTPYKIYFGGTYTGGGFVGGSSGWGLYTGGTYSATGAVLKASPTMSGSATVNTISF